MLSCFGFYFSRKKAVNYILVSENYYFWPWFVTRLALVRDKAVMDEEPEFELVNGQSKTGFLVEEIDCLPDETYLLKSLVNESDYVGRRLTTDTRVPSNIHKPMYRDFWLETLKPSEYVKNIIQFGYKLPFTSEPPKSFSQNNLSARQDEEFVRAEILRLENLDCIERVDSSLVHIVLPLSSVFSKKKRLVVDASRGLNPYLEDRRVRLQDHRDIPTFVKCGDIFTVDDLDSGYWLG